MIPIEQYVVRDSDPTELKPEDWQRSHNNIIDLKIADMALPKRLQNENKRPTRKDTRKKKENLFREDEVIIESSIFHVIVSETLI